MDVLSYRMWGWVASGGALFVLFCLRRKVSHLEPNKLVHVKTLFLVFVGLPYPRVHEVDEYDHAVCCEAR